MSRSRALGLFAARSLFTKELRELAPAVIGLTFLPLLAYAFMASRTVGETPLPRVIATLCIVFVAALFGALFFGLEAQQRTRGLLLALPVPRSRIFAAKLAGSILCFGFFLVVSRLQIALLSPIAPPELTAGEWILVVAFAGLAWTLAARLSLDFQLAPLVIVFGLLAFPAVVAVEEGISPVPVVVAWVVAAAELVRRFQTLEDRRSSAVGFGGLPGRFSASLVGIEWRRKGAIMLAVLLSPVVLTLFSGGISFGAFIVALFAGLVLGVDLWSDSEREDTADFFLQHLPIPRRRLVAVRALASAAIGIAVAAELALFLALHLASRQDLAPALREVGDPLLQAIGMVAVMFFLPFIFGAIVSPWLSHPVLGWILALLTTLAVLTSPWILSFGEGGPWWPTVAVLITGGAIAWWSNVHSRAFEPGKAKTLRAMALLAPFWLLMAW